MTVPMDLWEQITDAEVRERVTELDGGWFSRLVRAARYRIRTMLGDPADDLRS
jgi:hypothetical protein